MSSKSAKIRLFLSFNVPSKFSEPLKTFTEVHSRNIERNIRTRNRSLFDDFVRTALVNFIVNVYRKCSFEGFCRWPSSSVFPLPPLGDFLTFSVGGAALSSFS